MTAWENNLPSSPYGAGMTNLMNKITLNENSTAANGLGLKGMSWNIGKDELEKNVKIMNQEFRKKFDQFYEKNIAFNDLKIFQDVLLCFDPINYASYETDKDVKNEYITILERIATPLCKDTKLKNGRIIKSLGRIDQIRNEFELCKKRFLWKNRNTFTDSRNISKRMNWVYNQLKRKYSSSYSQLIKVYEFYHSQIIHMIYNERLNSLRTETQTV